MRFRKLSEIAPSGASPAKPAPDETVWLLTLDQIESGSGKIGRRGYGPASDAGTSTFVFDTGNVLYSKLRPYLNKVICPDSSGIATTELVPLRPIPGELTREFLCFYLRSPEFVSWASAQVDGAKMPRMKMKSFWAHEMPLPPLDDQIRIARLLGKVEGVIAQRKQHLQQLDDLLKSVFFYMFGDVRTKKSTYPWVALRPYLKANSGKSSKGVTSEINTGIPIYGGNGVNGWAKEALYDSPVVIAGRVGQQCGVIHVSKGPCWVTDNAIVLSISDHSRLDTIYLAKAFRYAPIRERVKQLDLPFINQSMLLDYPLPLPPIHLQKKFSAIVERVEALKSRYQQSLTDLEALYGALSQQAFKGELDVSRVALPAAPIDGESSVADAVPVPITTPVIELPETDLLLPALQDRTQLAPLLRFWLEAYRTQLGSAAFSLERFIAAAQTRLTELHSDDDFEWTASDYDYTKAWVFEALAAGALTQAFDDDGNRIELRAAAEQSLA
ncbi:MAG: restriction endonuclease subunit S [Burkholderiales bacterium]|nr:restriction endonuclease subunit S [Burkholderiales bacterium]